jgi:hypothetical protein
MLSIPEPTLIFGTNKVFVEESNLKFAELPKTPLLSKKCHLPRKTLHLNLIRIKFI